MQTSNGSKSEIPVISCSVEFREINCLQSNQGKEEYSE